MDEDEIRSGVQNFLKHLIESKLKVNMTESKAVKLFEHVARHIKTRHVPCNSYLFTKYEEIDNLYILVSGKVGLSKASHSKIQILSSKVPNFELYEECFDIISKP